MVTIFEHILQYVTRCDGRDTSAQTIQVKFQNEQRWYGDRGKRGVEGGKEMDEVLLRFFHTLYQDLVLLHDAYEAFQDIPAKQRRIEDFAQGLSALVEMENMYHLAVSYEESGQNDDGSINALGFVKEVLLGSYFLEFISDELSQVRPMLVHRL